MQDCRLCRAAFRQFEVAIPSRKVLAVDLVCNHPDLLNRRGIAIWRTNPPTGRLLPDWCPLTPVQGTLDL